MTPVLFLFFLLLLIHVPSPSLTQVPPLPAPLPAAAPPPSSSSCYKNSLKISSEYVTHRFPKLVIGHRGAAFHLPEHTLASYRLALELQADYIEPDLVATKDKHLIAIHTCDLSITTNVEDVFDDTRKWFSPYLNRTGYWCFNFTLDEIHTNLTVKQRVGPARSKLYNNQYTIPSLEEMLRVLNKWNTVDLPYILGYGNVSETTSTNGNHPTPLELAQSGMYAEFKDYKWLKQEAGIDLVELLFQHFETHSKLWEPLQYCYKSVPYDQFRVPSLVLQSFDAASLQAFHERWQTSSLKTRWAEPPYILLTKFPMCTEDSFWFNIGDNYRSFLNGIGCEKSCLLDEVEGRAFRSKAEEFELEVHAWTERPEQEYVKHGSNVVAETQYLFCDMKAGAVFSESVSSAVMVASWPGPDEATKNKKNGNNNSNTSSATFPGAAGNKNQSSSEGGGGEGSTAANASSKYCYESDAQSNFYIGLGAFIVGGFVTGLLILCVSGRKWAGQGGGRMQHGRSPPTYQCSSSQVPTNDLNFQVEMT